MSEPGHDVGATLAEYASIVAVVVVLWFGVSAGLKWVFDVQHPVAIGAIPVAAIGLLLAVHKTGGGPL